MIKSQNARMVGFEEQRDENYPLLENREKTETSKRESRGKTSAYTGYGRY